MGACLALEPPRTLDAGLPVLSGRLGQVGTRKEAFDLLAEFLQSHSLPDLILTFIPPGDLANQTVQWSTLASDRQALMLSGFKVIDRAKFEALSDAIILDWHRKGWLALIHFHFLSLDRFADLLAHAEKDTAPADAAAETEDA
ncbi:SapC family protein [Sphingopyxis sp.]|uniref:SapC family protein n=1 Tax=Sphingopyxis sp. TaxID=1908224 RepID=UPI003D6D1076